MEKIAFSRVAGKWGEADGEGGDGDSMKDC